LAQRSFRVTQRVFLTMSVYIGMQWTQRRISCLRYFKLDNAQWRGPTRA